MIDPRPYSDEEAEALRYGIQKFPMTEEENFFFGLTVQTQYGAVKTIPFFAPDRQNFLEYDISYLIDTVTARQKKRIGVLSSLPVMGDDDKQLYGADDGDAGPAAAAGVDHYTAAACSSMR